MIQTLAGIGIILAGFWLALTWRKPLKRRPWTPPMGTYPRVEAMSDDGKALMAVDHPVGEIQVTDAMKLAGQVAFTDLWFARDYELDPDSIREKVLPAVFIAMVKASPPEPEINEDALEEIEISISPRFAELVQELRILAAQRRLGRMYTLTPEAADQIADILEVL